MKKIPPKNYSKHFFYARGFLSIFFTFFQKFYKSVKAVEILSFCFNLFILRGLRVFLRVPKASSLD